MKNLQFWILSIIFPYSILIAEETKFVSDIIFIGNSALSKSELKTVIRLQLPRFFIRSEFSPKKLNRDKISLETYYKSKGFLKVEITEEYVLDAKKYVKINFIINEGNLYKLKDLEIYGNKLFSDKEILAMLNATIDQYYNPAGIRKELLLLKKIYKTHSKLNIAIMDERNIEDNYVIVRINISEGKTYHIQNINVTGLETVKEKYILRELLFSSGELYNSDLIDKSRNRIFKSGLFSSIEMEHTNINNELGFLDININVREYKSSSVEANIGFKELKSRTGNLRTTGLDTNAKWIMGNIFNTSSNIQISARLASEINLAIFTQRPLVKRDFTITYRNPWTLFYKFPSKIEYFHEEELGENKKILDGITYSISFNKDRNTRYKIESTVEMLQSDNDTDPLREIKFEYISNRIQNPLNPEGGRYILLSSSLYGTILGGEKHFYKIQGEYRKYVKVLYSSVFAFRMFSGYIYNLDEPYTLDENYLFNIGGQTSLRGWSSTKDYDPNGGLINDMINLEFRFPMWKKIGGEFFIDCGRLYDKINLFTSTQISWDYGIGLIYNTTLGPIRIDIGFPYGDLEQPQLHASLLYMF